MDMMNNMIQIHEKVYVLLGNEGQEDEDLLTLNWVIKKWGSHHPISIIILYITSSSSKDFVITPLGKLPASAVSDDKLEIIRKCEQEKVDNLLSKYVAFCGKVKTEIHKIDKHNEPIQNMVIELIMEHRITKLVMGMTFMRSSSGRSKSAISGTFYAHRNKPEFCELYIICKGKLVILKEENEEEGYIEDEQGAIVAKLKPKPTFKGWLGRMLSQGQGKPPLCPSSSRTNSSWLSTDSDSPNTRNQWMKHEQDIDEYFQALLMLESKSNSGEDTENESCLNSPTEQDIPNSLQDIGDGVEALRTDIKVVHKMIELYKNQAKAEVDRQAKASRAICLCNHRAEELEAKITEEIATREELTQELDNTKEELYEIMTDVQESKSKLSSLLELESELLTKLQVASLAKRGAEIQLDNAAHTRVELVGEIEQLRKQRDVFQRRIEFCKEKDAIGMATRMSEQVSCSCREFTADEIRLATDGFATHRRLKSGGDWTNVYKGRINRSSVAIKMLDSEVNLSLEIFQAKVNFLGNIQHQRITGLIGFCSELKCLIFEYMHNGCLRDILFSRKKGRILQWHHRIQIAAQVSSGLAFLHLAEPKPIVHNSLKPSSIFLDRNFEAKINALELTPCHDEADVLADVGGFGDLLLQLLTGRNWARLDQESMKVNKQVIIDALDDNAGDWPLDIAQEIVDLAMICWSIFSEGNVGEVMSSVTEELSNLKKNADDLIARREYHTGNEDVLYSGQESTQSSPVPSIFLCPILRVVMENPHIAADGFSYEFEAIEDWLGMGHDTSPVTNLKLKHKHLVPNITLRLLIQDWHNQKSILSR